MIRNSIVKFVSVSLIIGLNWAGLSAILETTAYLNDTETSSNNIYTASTLDFSLSSLADFSPEVTPVVSSNKDVGVSNDGILGFQYKIKAINFTGELCDFLNLEASLDGNVKYTGSLTGFDYNTGEFSSPEQWHFKASLIGDDPALEQQNCSFNIVFNGEQIGGAGFSDEETSDSVISSGTWSTPITINYSPIADSYVNKEDSHENYGDNSELKVKSKNDSKDERTFIKFGINLPNGTTIQNANLKLYMKDAPSQPRIYETRRVLGNWKERDPNGIDWNNQPTASSSVTDATSTDNANPKWLSWSVTGDVQSFVSGIFNNYGWRINDSIEGSEHSYEGKFYSRESTQTSKRPVLEITFIPPEITTAYPVINEVYYDVSHPSKGDDPNNEWVEIYNPTNSAVDISGWKICDNEGCDVIPATAPIPAKGFAIASGISSTWETYWTLPVGTITIDLPGNRIGGGSGLSNSGDRVILKNASDVVIDAMSYGNDDSQLDPAVQLSGDGKSLARIIKGYDTDSAFDWIINISPNPGTNPSENGEEIMLFTTEGVVVAATLEDISYLTQETQDTTNLTITEETDESLGSDNSDMLVDVGTEIVNLIEQVFEEATSDEVILTPNEDGAGAPTENVEVEEVPAEPAEEVIPEVIPEEPPVIEEQPVVVEETIVEEQPAVVVEPPVVVEEPITIEPPVPPPVDPPAPTE